MKKTTTLDQGRVEGTQKKWGLVKWTLSAAVLAALLGIGINWSAQEVQPQKPSLPQSEVVKNETSLAIHGMLGLWSNGIAWDNATVLSTNPSLTGVLSVSHPKSGFGVTAIRVDDFNQNDLSQPSSRATVINPNWKTNFWKNKQFWMTLDWKYTLLDKNPDLRIVTTDIVWSYSTKTWWTFEWMYLHNFTNWSDAFRLSVSKQLDDAVKVVTQLWADSGYWETFYGRLMVDVKLKEWITVQVSCIVKDWKLTPTVFCSVAF